MRGIISQTFDWLAHPGYSAGSVGDWFAFVIIVLLLSYLYNTGIVKQITEG